MKRELVVMAAAILTVVGCSLFTRGLHTLDDIAHAACVLTFSDPKLEADAKARMGGLTPEEFCKGEEVLRPFLEQQKAGMHAAKATLSRPAP